MSSRFKWKRIFGVLILFLLAIGTLLWTFSERSFPSDANLVVTVASKGIVLPAGGNIFERMSWKLYQLKRKHFPNPLSYRFPASNERPCSIHGLLSQAMEVSGTKYLIEKRVASGSVNFGSTNALNGSQWVRAFERALQQNVPEWHDSGKMRKENLVLLQYNARTVLVLSQERAAEYQKKHPLLKRISPE